MEIAGFVGYYFSSKLSASLDEVYTDYLLPAQWLNDARNQSRAGEADIMELLNASIDKQVAQKRLLDMDQHNEEASLLWHKNLKMS